MSRPIKQTVFEKFPFLEDQWDFEKNNELGLDPSKLNGGSSQAVWWKCPFGHSWKSQIAYRGRTNSICKICSGSEALRGFNTIEVTHPDLLKEWDYSKNLFQPHEFTAKSESKSKKPWWICKNGHSWQAFVRIRANGVGCKECYLTPNPEYTIAQLPQSLRSQISSLNDPELIEKISIRSPTSIIWKCELGHTWSAQIGVRWRTNGVFGKCPYCENRKFLSGFNDLETLYLELAKENLSEKESKLLFYKSAETIEWLCQKCSRKELCSVVNRVQRGCSRCNRRESKFEIAVVDYLIELKIPFTRRFRKLKKSLRSKSRYEIDIYLPELGLGFEVQDFTTHSKNSDFEVGHPWAKNKLKHGPKYHNLKREIAKKQFGVDLIDLWEDEILSGEFERIVDLAILEASDKLSDL